MLQTVLLILLFIIEIFAFGWLIWDAKLGREKKRANNSTRKTNTKTRESNNNNGKNNN